MNIRNGAYLTHTIEKRTEVIQDRAPHFTVAQVHDRYLQRGRRQAWHHLQHVLFSNAALSPSDDCEACLDAIQAFKGVSCLIISHFPSHTLLFLVCLPSDNYVYFIAGLRDSGMHPEA